jgi:hypothetical protein
MGIRIAEIARITGAVIEGNADIEISVPGKLEEADERTLNTKHNFTRPRQLQSLFLLILNPHSRYHLPSLGMPTPTLLFVWCLTPGSIPMSPKKG